MAGPTARMLAQRRREREEAEAQERAQSSKAGPQQRPSTTRFTGALSDAGAQARAFGRGAGNALTFGFYDPIAASIEATAQGGGLNRWQDRFRADLGKEQAQDRYEAARYPTARTSGQVGGTLLSLAAGGPVSGGARIAGAAGMTAREAGTWLAAHGVLGAGLQTASDLVSGRPLSWKDDLGAAVGGATAAGLGVRLPPGRAAAIGGAVSSAAQDLLNNRPVSLQGVADGTLGGRLAGGLAGRLGRDWSNGLSTQAKGNLGEDLGALRNSANGKPTGRLVAKERDKLGDGPQYWYPDRKLGDLRYEDKFGHTAKLRTNQKIAQNLLGNNFALNHFLPDDVGKLLGLPAGSAATRPLRRPQR
jgi:hypothetical protein